MTATILPLHPFLTYQAALDVYTSHREKCCLCEDHKLCEEGLALNFLAWALMCPQPRRSVRQPAQRRRSS